MGIGREGLTMLLYFTLLPPPTLALAAWDRQWSPYKLKMSERAGTAETVEGKVKRRGLTFNIEN